jgi:hypothetical protein
MSTVANLIEEARYDLVDYQDGLEYDDKLLFVYINRLITVMDSVLSSLRSDYTHGIEEGIDCVADQNFVDLTNMNNSNWDSLRYVWIGEDRKYPVSIDQLFYKRKFRDGSQEPQFWTTEEKRLLWEADCDSAHTDLVIHYNKKHRKRLASWSDTYEAATTDVLTLASGNHTFTTGDGPFTVSTTGTLPTGLSASTNDYLVFQPSDLDGIKLSTSKINALEESVVDITASGSGTHTITLGDDVMPYSGSYDGVLREMLVMHARAKGEGKIGQPEAIYGAAFKKRAMEETIRRKFREKYYVMDY